MKLTIEQLRARGRKGRVRKQRGALPNWESLPLSAQEDFKKAASFALSAVTDHIEPAVYVYGSYHWGNWDEESDYDLFMVKRESHTDKALHNPNFTDDLKSKHGFLCDIQFGSKSWVDKQKLIKIPV